jgi:hypothetical protein
MKYILLITVIGGFSMFLACAGKNEAVISGVAQLETSREPVDAKIKRPILVELFTSEGCSSCPPADRVLAQLEKEQNNADADIITLALHVDYWNYLGWKDEFSSPLFSERQNGYAEKFKLDSIYTPQMVIDGQTQFVGSNLETAQKTISDAGKNEKADVKLSIETSTTNLLLKVKISNFPARENSNVWLAIAEDDLKTNVRRGENSGKTLDHVSVVRELKLLGNFASTDKIFETESVLSFQPAWKKENLKLIVFAQGTETKRVYAVSQKSLK